MTTTIPAGWKLVPVKATDEMEVAAENDYVQTGYTFPRWKSHYAAMLNAAPAAPGASTAGNPHPARDWELTCHECDGSGHVYVKHQVAERQTDMQEFKEECECCEGRGFVFAFQDIPGIEEYVKACRTAPAAGDALDAARWRFVRRKLCLTGNGDGTCAMQAINLPASIPGWPEPGSAVAEFCDAAIDTAIAAQRKGDA
ncbi:hypothetical protein ACOTCW_29285 [Achromobacter xylosoxidans]